VTRDWAVNSNVLNLELHRIPAHLRYLRFLLWNNQKLTHEGTKVSEGTAIASEDKTHR
jgi:hypothetical protein